MNTKQILIPFNKKSISEKKLEDGSIEFTIKGTMSSDVKDGSGDIVVQQ
jgi:hypothetical protein